MESIFNSKEVVLTLIETFSKIGDIDKLREYYTHYKIFHEVLSSPGTLQSLCEILDIAYTIPTDPTYINILSFEDLYQMWTLFYKSEKEFCGRTHEKAIFYFRQYLLKLSPSRRKFQ